SSLGFAGHKIPLELGQDQITRCSYLKSTLAALKTILQDTRSQNAFTVTIYIYIYI
ncbi:unnamed protein product, partial [Musa textilis]